MRLSPKQEQDFLKARFLAAKLRPDGDHDRRRIYPAFL